jgi:epoxyqueuosine reductase QueG
MLVQHEAGLWLSLRGALALRQRIDLPAPAPSPCESCSGQPCRTACPVGALGDGPYDIAACHGHIAAPEGADCMEVGCRARRACPVSSRYPREPAQSAFHMRAFTGTP